MIKSEAVLREWGNSLGITLSKEVIKREKLKNNDKIEILIIKKRKMTPSEELFGSLKGCFKKSAQQMKDDMRKELYND